MKTSDHSDSSLPAIDRGSGSVLARISPDSSVVSTMDGKSAHYCSPSDREQEVQAGRGYSSTESSAPSEVDSSTPGMQQRHQQDSIAVDMSFMNEQRLIQRPQAAAAAGSNSSHSSVRVGLHRHLIPHLRQQQEGQQQQQQQRQQEQAGGLMAHFQSGAFGHQVHLASQHPQQPHPGATQAASAASAIAQTQVPRLHHHHHHDYEQQQQSGGSERTQGGGGGTEGGGNGGDAEDNFSGMMRNLLAQNPEVRSILSAFEQYIPFALLVSIKLLFDHGTGLVVFTCLLITSLHSNSVVRQEVSKQDRKNLPALATVLVYLIACVALIYFVFQDQQLYNCALFLPPSKVESLYDLIWLVGVNDFILKFGAVIVKILLVFMPPRIIPYQRRGKYFLFVERASQLHRELAPIQVWLSYLLFGYERINGKMLGVVLVACYIISKGRRLLKGARHMHKAVCKLMQSTTYGQSPTAEQIKSAGGSCPICYEPFQRPSVLHCRHVFCEDCLSAWFDREKTCPLCRAQITEDPAWRDGSTSQVVQLY